VFEVMNIASTIMTEHRDSRLAEHADVLIEPDLSAFNAARFHDAAGIIAAGYQATIAQIPRIKALVEEQTALQNPLKRLLWQLGILTFSPRELKVK
jgi:predicted acylesterase/phospholipase RssA